MAEITIAEAVALADRFGTSKLAWTQLAYLGNGRLRAASLDGGCDLPLPGYPEIYVEAGKLRRMLVGIGEGAAVKVTGKGKTRRLEVSGGGSTFTLQVVQPGDHPGFPEVPEEGWTSIPADQARAIAAAGSLIDDSVGGGSYDLAGIRLGNGVVCGLAGWGGLRALVPAADFAPVTAQPLAFEGCDDVAVDFARDQGRGFVRAVSTGVVRWSSLLEGDYPDQLIVDVIAGASNPLAVLRVSLPELHLLCRQAQIVQSDAYRLQIEGAELVLRTAKEGPSEFRGTLAGERVGGADSAEVGILVGKFLRLALAVGSAAGVESVDMALGAPTQPFLFRAGEHVTGVMMPQVL